MRCTPSILLPFFLVESFVFLTQAILSSATPEPGVQLTAETIPVEDSLFRSRSPQFDQSGPDHGDSISAPSRFGFGRPGSGHPGRPNHTPTVTDPPASATASPATPSTTSTPITSPPPPPPPPPPPSSTSLPPAPPPAPTSTHSTAALPHPTSSSHSSSSVSTHSSSASSSATTFSFPSSPSPSSPSSSSPLSSPTPTPDLSPSSSASVISSSSSNSKLLPALIGTLLPLLLIALVALLLVLRRRRRREVHVRDGDEDGRWLQLASVPPTPASIGFDAGTARAEGGGRESPWNGSDVHVLGREEKGVALETETEKQSPVGNGYGGEYGGGGDGDGEGEGGGGTSRMDALWNSFGFDFGSETMPRESENTAAAPSRGHSPSPSPTSTSSRGQSPSPISAAPLRERPFSSASSVTAVGETGRRECDIPPASPSAASAVHTFHHNQDAYDLHHDASERDHDTSEPTEDGHEESDMHGQTLVLSRAPTFVTFESEDRTPPTPLPRYARPLPKIPLIPNK